MHQYSTHNDLSSNAKTVSLRVLPSLTRAGG